MTDIFQRYEEKYIITKTMQAKLLSQMGDMICPDLFGNYRINNLYFDTTQYDLIRASIEKPVYKEKLRLRGYGERRSNAIFLEMKKKYNGVVYKRRIKLSPEEEQAVLSENPMINEDSQVRREIKHFMHVHPVAKKVFIAYDRKAYRGTKINGLRITLDSNIIFQQQELSLYSQIPGKHLLDTHQVLMEIKFEGAMPLEISRILSENKVFPCSFSKYGECYKKYICRNIADERSDTIA